MPMTEPGDLDDLSLLGGPSKPSKKLEMRAEGRQAECDAIEAYRQRYGVD